MKSLHAFIKKETMEQFRSGRLMILGILFVLLGVMNPAVAKITPWLLEILADSLAESGMTVTPVTVSAMDSWVQFFKKMICFQTIRKGLTMQTTVSSEKKYAPPKRSEKQIGNTTFIVNSFFREKSDESIAVKLERLMKADVQKEATT